VREGAFVYLTGRRQNDLDMAAALIGDGVAPVRGDVQNRGDLDRLYERIKQEKGKIDILVANAGFIDPQPLVDATEENFDKTFGTNVRGLLFTVQKALPLFSDGGAIILISSIAAFKGIPRYTAYSATKASVRSCARGRRNSRTVASVSMRSAPARLTRPSSTRRRQRKKALTRMGGRGPRRNRTLVSAPVSVPTRLTDPRQGAYTLPWKRQRRKISRCGATSTIRVAKALPVTA